MNSAVHWVNWNLFGKGVNRKLIHFSLFPEFNIFSFSPKLVYKAHKYAGWEGLANDRDLLLSKSKNASLGKSQPTEL